MKPAQPLQALPTHPSAGGRTGLFGRLGLPMQSLLLLLLVLLVLPAPLAPPPPPQPQAVARAAAPAVAPATEAVAAQARPAALPTIAAAAPTARREALAVPALARTAAPATDEAQVCGLGRVRLDDERPLPEHHIPDHVRAQALQRLGLAMATSPDPRVRAAEMLLRARTAIAPEALATAADADLACRQAHSTGLDETARFCADDLARSQAALLAPAAPAIDELARLALLAGDAQVYAFAFEACALGGLSFYRHPGNCQRISAEQWARLAPGSAAPWLHLAAQAQARGDADAISAALMHAAAAQATGSATQALPALAAAAQPAGLPALQQAALQIELNRLSDGAMPAALRPLNRLCAGDALQDATRRLQCDALARRLVARGQASASVSLGVQLGELLGWPAERTQALLRRQRDALAAVQHLRGAPQALACDGLQRQHEVLLLAGRLGDLGAGLALLQREVDGPRAASTP